MTVNLVVYTCLFGPECRDKLQPVPKSGEGVEYHAYVDSFNQQEVQGWQIRNSIFADMDPRLRARHHKAVVHKLYPDIPVTMWLDGSHTPKYDPLQMIEWYLEGYDLMAYRHHKRGCIYQEAEACRRLQKDDPIKIRNQIGRYRGEKYPYHNGLAETTVLLRTNLPVIVEFNELWWEEILHGSCRDQISFPYVAWRLNLPWGQLPGTAWGDREFNWKNHWA